MKPEDRLVEKIRSLAGSPSTLTIGPGDDAAVMVREAGLLAATTDMLVEGIDFLRDEEPERVGRRAASVNLSDLAAMGADPEFFLLSLGVPTGRGEETPLAIARGAIARSAAFGATLAGGDLSAAPVLIVSIALWGRPAGEPLTRSGASPGELVYLTGHPGEAAAGLRIAQRAAAFRSGDDAPPHFAELSPEHEKKLLTAFRDPEPRVRLGALLARERLATACIDVSDGLGVDAGRLARASGVRLILEKDRLPISQALLAFTAAEDLDPVELAVAGGDDYELLFTVRETDAPAMVEAAAKLGVPVRAIGRSAAGAGVALTDARGERDIEALGHDHFETAR